MLTIVKVLNNNFALAVDEAGRDCIAMGKGIAFGRRFGDEIDPEKVERLFTQHVPELSRRLVDLAPLVPEEYFDAARDIVDHARLRLGHELDDGIYLALADHIHFAVERAQSGIMVTNHLTFEIGMVYPEEFECAQTARAFLERIFDVSLPADEAAFIALHFVNAGTGVGMEGTAEMARIVHRAVSIVSEMLEIELDRESLAYYRFMVHLRFFAQRVVGGASCDSAPLPEDRRLIAMVQHEYRDAAACAEAVAEFVECEHNEVVPPTERMYLAMHIERLRSGGLSARREGDP
ncbi:PRD domain-containing protein [Collinsella sp. AGMB00827]|uniref:PRD domain-containing protein n=1 Tax=Collinsella ureilytica TaxID=2869515 RepID=A0ABS7MIH1_9ACTN|nr:PRD domain-containing protein [Collinsella urealyticum]